MWCCWRAWARQGHLCGVDDGCDLVRTMCVVVKTVVGHSGPRYIVVVVGQLRPSMGWWWWQLWASQGQMYGVGGGGGPVRARVC